MNQKQDIQQLLQSIIEKDPYFLEAIYYLFIYYLDQE